MTRSNLTILFWLKKNRLKNGKAPIYARITIEGIRAEFSICQEVSIFNWDTKAQFVKHTAPDAQKINSELLQFKTKIQQCQTVIEYRGLPVTIEALKNEFNGVVEKPRMLLEVIQQHNNDIEKLIGKDYTITSWRKYRTMFNLVKCFVKWKFKQNDIALDLLKHSFITDFEFYLKVERNINPATNPKYIKNLQKIIRQCVVNEWLIKDPFLGYKLKIKTSERGFLTDLELQTLHEKYFEIERIEHVRDVFLFSCYTGLSYIDIFNLTPNNISVGIDGKKWIFTHRQKTDVASRIPLLQPALEILEKYMNHPSALNQSKLLPISSNQKVNAYLKEIADCCGIKKVLTFHMARHTFATTVTLNNGVPIESVSKMLGHTKIQTTQIYAKILDKKVSFDMQQLRKVFENNELTKTKAVGQ